MNLDRGQTRYNRSCDRSGTLPPSVPILLFIYKKYKENEERGVNEVTKDERTVKIISGISGHLIFDFSKKYRDGCPDISRNYS